MVFMREVAPETVIMILYSKLLLTPEEKEKATQRMLTLHQQLDWIFVCLERRVSSDPFVFHELVQGLLNEPALEGVGKKIQG